MQLRPMLQRKKAPTMTINHRIWSVAAATICLSACTANDTGLGNAVRTNYAAQIVDPEPEYSETMVTDGNQSAGAQERYRNGSVKKPVGVKTTETISGGSGTGSSSGGI